MQIILLIGQAPDHPAIPTLTAKLQEVGVPYQVVSQAFGNISVIPCIGAIDSTGVVRQSWYGDSIQASAITTAAGQTPSPIAVPLKVYLKADFARAIAGVIGVPGFATCWGNTTFQIYMSLMDKFGHDDLETIAVLNAAVTSGGMSAPQRTAILAQWPTQ